MILGSSLADEVHFMPQIRNFSAFFDYRLGNQKSPKNLRFPSSVFVFPVTSKGTLDTELAFLFYKNRGFQIPSLRKDEH